jgi:ABC-type xylose transport system permease subunit
MKKLGILGGIGAAFAALVGALTMPSLRRYLKLKRM